MITKVGWSDKALGKIYWHIKFYCLLVTVLCSFQFVLFLFPRNLQ